MPFPDTRESLAIPHRQDNGARAAGSDVDADAPVVQDRSHRCGAHRCDGDPTRAVDIRLRTDSDASPKTPPGYIAEHRGTSSAVSRSLGSTKLGWAGAGNQVGGPGRVAGPGIKGCSRTLGGGVPGLEG